MPSSGERLDRLAERVGGTVLGDGSVTAVDVTHDSRQVGVGSLFVAVRGFTADGHTFVPAAASSGAVGVVVESQVDTPLPQIVVPDTRAALAELAAGVFHDPSHHLRVVGVTGTNGKTTVAYLVESIARAAGEATGLIGTVVTRIGDDLVPSARTTPEASDLQRLFRTMVDRGVGVAVMEVSSHALALGRADTTRFVVGAFTNLSQDHLDFHRDMEEYFRAKATLFEPERTGHAVVCIDDEYGRRLAESCAVPLTTVSVAGDADISGRVIEARATHTVVAFDLGTGQDEVLVSIPLAGDFNAANAAVALGVGLRLGYSIDRIVEGLGNAPPVPGRFEVVSGTDPVVVIVDYAHTPAGVETVVATARRLTTGRVLAVLGAGGDRDRSKRPLMGRAASAADLAVVTSDNPRSEDPDAIIDEVISGFEQVGGVLRRPDRRQAIHDAIAAASDGDIVLVLGKGHERGQEIAGRVYPFDDREVARQELAAVRGELG